MQKKNNVSSVADIFGLNASALRFWEKEGLIRFERDAENNYRLPTLSAVEDIWEIVFLKNLALSAKQIREILRACPEDIKSILADNENRLKGEIEKLQTALYKLEQKKRMLDVFSSSTAARFTSRRRGKCVLFPSTKRQKRSCAAFSRTKRAALRTANAERRRSTRSFWTTKPFLKSTAADRRSKGACTACSAWKWNGGTTITPPNFFLCGGKRHGRSRDYGAISVHRP